MDSHVLDAFIANLKKNGKPLKGVSIRSVNWDEFAVTKKNKGKLNLANIASLYEWSKSILQSSAQQLDFIITYHPESPKYWLKDIENEKDDDGNYNVALNLETFMESKNAKDFKKKGLGFYIPDNYELAKIALKEFNKHYGKRHKLCDVSFREIAMWKSKSLDEVKALASFLEKRYVAPDMKLVLKRNRIRKVIFTKDSVDFKCHGRK